MKQLFRFFTLLALAVVTSTSAWAIDVPKPKAKPLTVGAEVYILNVGTGKYAGQGEGWSTQSVVNDMGLKYILKNKRDDGAAIAFLGDEVTELPEGQYWLYSPDINIANRHSTDRWNDGGRVGDGIKCCFTDQSDWDSRGVWQVTLVGENTYKFTVPEGLPDFLEQQNQYVEGEALGVQNDHASNSAVDGVTWGLYHDVVYEDAPEMCQFQFFDPADIDIYKAKLELAKMCDDALEVDLNIDSYVAIIQNENATIEEISAAVEELKAKLKEADSWNYPQDITEGIIVNPNPYEGSMNGWTVLDGNGKPVSSWGGDPEKKSGWNYWIGEFWNSGGYSISQTIKIPAGVYTLRLWALTRPNMNAVLKAGENQTFIGRDPNINDRSAAYDAFAAGKYANDVSWVQLEDGELEISLTADNSTGDHWLPWRNFELLDRGANMRSYQKAAAALAEGWQDEFIDENGEPRDIFTQSYFDAITAAVESIPTSTNTETAYAIYKQVQQSLNDLRMNVFYYKELRARTFDESNFKYEDPYDAKFGGNAGFPDVWDEAQTIFNDEDYTKTNEYLEDLYNRYMEARQNAIFTVIEAARPGESVTGYIENPSFKNEDGTAASFAGWTVASSSTFQNNAGSVPVIEQWNGSSNMGVIDVYQNVAIRKVGAYRLKTKGWYRSTTVQDTHDNTEGYQTVNTFLYGASSEYKFHDIYEHPYTPAEKQKYFPKGNSYNPADGSNQVKNDLGKETEEPDEEFIQRMADAGIEVLLPNNCTGANELFNNPEVDWYDMTCDFLGLGIDYPVKIGVKGRDVPGYAWLIWDDFEMIYLGNDLTTMKSIAQNTADNLREEFYVDGELKNAMAAAAKKGLDDCISGIENATSVDALVEAYKNADPAADAARKSVAAYKKVQTELDKLNDKIVDKADKALPERLNTAVELAQEIENGLAEGSIGDDEETVNALIKRIDDAIAGLNLPGNYAEASDDNAIDFTDMITNPKYIDSYTNEGSLSGWTEKGIHNVDVRDYVIGYAEGWGDSAENATFDIWQDIKGLPEGTYEVKVNGLFRQGGPAADAKMTQYAYAEALGKLDLLSDEAKKDVPEYTGAGQFYAVGNGVESYKPLHRWIFIGTDEWTEEAMVDFNSSLTGENSYITYIDSLTVEGEVMEYYFPHTRENLYARAMFDYYENAGLYANVGEDGVLRIGARNQNATAGDWTPFSNWRLYYLGTESKHATDGIRETEVNPALRTDAIYSIDGRRLNKLQKGLNIVVRNGKAQKIMVK